MDRLPFGASRLDHHVGRVWPHWPGFCGEPPEQPCDPLPLFIPATGSFPPAVESVAAGRQDISSPAVRLKYDLLEFESAHAGTQTPNAALTAAGQGAHSCI